MIKDNIQWVLNERFSPDYNKEELHFFNEETIINILNFQKTHSLYTKTPLLSLKGLAKHLNVSEILVKDESHRFGLNAFKVMGGIYAIGKFLANKLGKDINDISFKELQSAEVKKQLGVMTFISATDGNHGRGVAWAARELGQKSIIYLPKGSTEARLQAIRDEGAEAEITDMNYDETVAMCARLAEENNWIFVQDTGWEGYEEIPQWIMQGYAAIAKEIDEEIAEPPTHLILQAGVGSFAAGIAGYYLEKYRAHAPKIIIVEPDRADCYYRSFSHPEGEMVSVEGHMHSIMAGLCCGVPNQQAFRLLTQHGYGAFSVPDEIAALGMRILGQPISGDKRVISGESGAVPMGLLYHLKKYAAPEIADRLELDRGAKVLFISTEGDTDQENYQNIVWNGHYPYIKREEDVQK